MATRGCLYSPFDARANYCNEVRLECDACAFVNRRGVHMACDNCSTSLTSPLDT